MGRFYITTAIPYVNGLPHVGHSLEYFQADTIRRYYQIKGFETLLLSGADENALKNVQAAEKEGVPVQEFLDRNSKIWHDTYEALSIHLDVFQRSSDKHKHWPGVQKLWKLCEASGDIYKKSYKGLYCVGCEAFKNPDDLVNGKCPEHDKKPEVVEEENYFFKLSKYADSLIRIIETNELKILPANKRAETLAFIKAGLEDFSISRSNERAKGVGVPVPGDDTQKIYVWFDALNIYMTGIGFGWDGENWEKWWPADLHIIGKDINRFHSIYWPAMLLSAGLPLPKQILIHGFVNLTGEKISKSLGNVISPVDFAKEFGLESLRYYMLSQVPIDSDHDFSQRRFREIYNADLANGLGNLVARVAKLCEQENIEAPKVAQVWCAGLEEALSEFKFNEALNIIWQLIAEADKKVNEEKPWELTGEKLKEILNDLVKRILHIAFNLAPFLPETSEKILTQFASRRIKSGPVLFPRI